MVRTYWGGVAGVGVTAGFWSSICPGRLGLLLFGFWSSEVGEGAAFEEGVCPAAGLVSLGGGAEVSVRTPGGVCRTAGLVSFAGGAEVSVDPALGGGVTTGAG
jgi:hypothetical protein